jgi:hypothetical protein
MQLVMEAFYPGLKREEPDAHYSFSPGKEVKNSRFYTSITSS